MEAAKLVEKMLATFDEADDGHDEFYNHLPYVRDYNLCNWHPHGLFSGNIVKFYQYSMENPVIIQTDPDGM